MQMHYTEILHGWFVSLGLSDFAAAAGVDTLQVMVVFALAILGDLIVKKILVGVVAQFAARTETPWDDILVKRKAFHRIAQFAPAIIIYTLAPAAFELPSVLMWAQKSALVYMLVVGVLVLNAALNAANDIYQEFEVARRIPILGYLQVVKLVVTLAALITGVSIVIGKSPMLLLSGLGAMTAILLLVFKDTILGFVAGIQLVANDMVRPGDWLEMPKYGADGDVEEITLNVVKVRNWDMTVITIPTYALISDSFKNWRGMSESGGRRIKRSLLIDVSSIRFCPADTLAELKKIKKLAPYIQEREESIATNNSDYRAGEQSPANGRRLTNMGLFRQYAVEYLRENKVIRKDMTFLVRQLQPTAEGLPLEIYVFSADQRWVEYEAIQADIFDHLFSVLPLFNLRAFQKPTGADIASSPLGRQGAAAP
jgi:miniconductance mechanosensitive channel